MPGADSDAVLDQIQKHQSPRVTGFANLVEAGRVGLGPEHNADGEIQVVLNRARLTTEGHALPEALLSIARVI
jgi:hypothetical protein